MGGHGSPRGSGGGCLATGARLQSIARLGLGRDHPAPPPCSRASSRLAPRPAMGDTGVGTWGSPHDMALQATLSPVDLLLHCTATSRVAVAGQLPGTDLAQGWKTAVATMPCDWGNMGSRFPAQVCRGCTRHLVRSRPTPNIYESLSLHTAAILGASFHHRLYYARQRQAQRADNMVDISCDGGL